MRTESSRTTQRRRHRRSRRSIAAGVVAASIAGLLTACSSGSSGGPVTLTFYNFPDNSGADPAGRRHVHQAERRQVQDQLPEAAERRGRAAPANGPPPRRQGLVHGHPRPGRDVGGRVRRGGLDPAVDRPEQGPGRGRHAEGAARDGDVEGPALRRPVQQQHPAAVVPVRSRAQPAEDVGRDDQRRDRAGQAGQAASHRDPGRAVRRRHGVVQHDGRERRRQHPERRPRPRRPWAHPRSGRCRS